MPEKKKKITVAMSGGVDSTVVAALLKQQGYDVVGVFMDLAQPDLEDQLKRVKLVSRKLGVPLQIIDLTVEFRRQVIDYFCQDYLSGRTPNPCVVCNPAIKCGSLLNAVCPGSADVLATGHYARIVKGQAGYELRKGRDDLKDQSYFLCGLNQEQLARLFFPLGDLDKEEVYRMADELGFNDFRGKESQDVCFLQGGSVANFLDAQIVDLPGSGEIVDSVGHHLGDHLGVQHYTIGQRRGLGLCDPEPYYVMSIDVGKNRLVVGREKDLWQDRLQVGRIHWVSGHPPQLPDSFVVKIRYGHQGAKAQVRDLVDQIEIVFVEKQRAITPGQFAVLYDGDQVVGCGEIE